MYCVPSKTNASSFLQLRQQPPVLFSSQTNFERNEKLAKSLCSKFCPYKQEEEAAGPSRPYSDPFRFVKTTAAKGQSPQSLARVKMVNAKYLASILVEKKMHRHKYDKTKQGLLFTCPHIGELHQFCHVSGCTTNVHLKFCNKCQSKVATANRLTVFVNNDQVVKLKKYQSANGKLSSGGDGTVDVPRVVYRQLQFAFEQMGTMVEDAVHNKLKRPLRMISFDSTYSDNHKDFYFRCEMECYEYYVSVLVTPKPTMSPFHFFTKRVIFFCEHIQQSFINRCAGCIFDVHIRVCAICYQKLKHTRGFKVDVVKDVNDSTSRVKCQQRSK